MLEKQKKRYRRHRRIKSKVFGTAEKPRLYVFRSAKHIYAQLFNDEKGKILAEASDLKFSGARKISSPKTNKLKEKTKDKEQRTKKIEIAFNVGKLIAKSAKDLKIEKVVFDRGGYKYHGRVKALSEGAREEGLKF